LSIEVNLHAPTRDADTLNIYAHLVGEAATIERAREMREPPVRESHHRQPELCRETSRMLFDLAAARFENRSRGLEAFKRPTRAFSSCDHSETEFDPYKTLQ